MNLFESENNNDIKLSEIFPKSYFWEVDLDNFSLDNWEDRSFIIQRVLHMLDLEEGVLDKLENIFPINEIKYYAEGSCEILGNELIEVICARYDMLPSQFPHYHSEHAEIMKASGGYSKKWEEKIMNAKKIADARQNKK